MHARTYFGEFDAAPIVQWLNSKARPKDDPVETLLALNEELSKPMGATEHDARGALQEFVRVSKFAVAPRLKSAVPGTWRIDWALVGKMPPSLGLAFLKLLHLADRGLLGRLRRCANRGCPGPIWFYARFEHQRFHSARCRQEAFRSDPEWKKRRREYMKELRQEKKRREQRWLRASRRKEKR